MQALLGENSEEYVDITTEERANQLNELEQKLDQMEADIVEEERKIRIRQQEHEKEYGGTKKKWYKCKCLSTADIRTDIPKRFHRSVYNMYYLWLFNSLTLIINWIAMIIYHGFREFGDNQFIMTTLLVLAGIPGIIYPFYLYFLFQANKVITRWILWVV